MLINWKPFFKHNLNLESTNITKLKDHQSVQQS